ncbi:hypothetical protein LEMA_P120720.1 [Plenodomus lingam JN3]|uniref:Mitochondrial outer membrane transport complex Sam37/metaxin N-terminal domain-containing protein n=1 Tax=Leptosphaeria maculans (strain JN3 / isolate v23.1.3 / race Av1-4-5-6-7-8) TaxID=985895 RepID=E4ZSZ3_LEPMJ|nr:hypothetical protein LEMA_P120720.1 [Plenodomus lingam JN3]CBX94581.1 hypothetical protein LEMA_P120720.1 [Plenodomus lingam JN3]
MVLELHVWGPAFGLPSIEPECIATIAYCQQVLAKGQWSLVAEHVPSVGITASGFEDIVAYLRNHPTAATHDLDAKLSSRQRTDRIASVTDRIPGSTATSLIDLLLYVSAENYRTATSTAYTAILPWYANYTVPPRRRELAKARTSHMGLGSLEVDITAEEAFAPGRGTASSEYEAAKRAAGIPSDGTPRAMSMGRGKGFGGLLSGPVYAARFRLDAISDELLGPLSDLLGKHDYLFRGSAPSSLDCLTFGYLSLLYYPSLPQAWAKETLEARYPRLVEYMRRIRLHIFQDDVTDPSKVWSVMTGSADASRGMLLPWRPRRQALASSAVACTREILGNVPLVSLAFQRRSFVVEERQSSIAQHVKSELWSPLTVNALACTTAAFAIGLVTLAVHHRRSPREGALIFWALRPSVGLGEAGDILSVLAHQMPNGASLSLL